MCAFITPHPPADNQTVPGRRREHCRVAVQTSGTGTGVSVCAECVLGQKNHVS